MKKKKFKDFLGETKVRMTSFIKEHKYVTLGIAFFAIIGVIVGFVVFADDTLPTADVTKTTVKVDGVTPELDSSNQEILGYSAESFSDLTFNISYELNNPSEENVDIPVTITAEIKENVDAYWLDSNDSYLYEFTDASKKKVKISLYGKADGGKNTALLSLRLGNILGDTTGSQDNQFINPKISIETGSNNKKCTYNFSNGEEATCGDTTPSNDELDDENGILIIGDPVRLQPFLISGYPYKKDTDHTELSSGRYIPFGIILGLKLGDCEDCVSSLKGKYINPQQKISIISYETSASAPTPKYEFDDSTGLFDLESNNKISGMPNYKYNPEILSVIDSGQVTSPIISENKESAVFNINNLKASIDSPLINVNGEEIIAFGSYYATYKAISSTDISTRAFVTVSYGGILDTYSTIDITSKAENQYGTEIIKTKVEADEIKVNSDSNVNYNSTAKLSYGEDAKITTEYTYGIDGDIDVDKTISVLISPSEPVNSKIKIADDSSESADEPINVEINGKSVENPNIKYYKYNNNNECSEEIEMNPESTSTVLQQVNSANLCKITFSNDSDSKIKPGDKVNISFKIRSDDTAETNEYTISSFTESKSANKESTIEIKTVAFKARTKIYYSIPPKNKETDEYTEYDIINQTKTVYGNEESKATLVIYPTLTAPGLFINNNALGSRKKIDSYVRIELPEGVNYVPNDDYVKQPNSFVKASLLNPGFAFWEKTDESLGTASELEKKYQDGKILFYEYYTSQIDEYMEPIKIDISFDNTLADGTMLKIDSRIFSTYNTELGNQIVQLPFKDHETISYGNILYKISNSVLSSLVAPQTINRGTSDKPSEFDIIASIANRTSNQLENIDLIIDTPTEGYNGDLIYNFGDEIPLCSTSSAGDDWNECPTDIGNEIKRIKYHIDTLASNQISNRKISISTVDNEPDDEYNFVLSVVLNESNLEPSKKYIKVKVNSPSISGVVWQDFNKNGYIDDSLNEEKVDDVLLHLFKAKVNDAGKILSSEFIDSTVSYQGKYRFNITDEEATYYIVPEYDENKYGLTSYHGDVSDISKMSSYKLYEDEDLNPNLGLGSSLRVRENNDAEDEIIDQNEENPDEDEIFDPDENNPDEDEPGDGDDDNGDEGEEDDNENNDEEDEYKPSSTKIRSDIIYVNSNKKNVQNINLGLTLKEVFKVKMNKYITSAITTNSIGMSSTKNFGNVGFAKLDVKNINSLNIKVIYTIKVKNIGFYPGYVTKITDIIPDGMVFNDSYPENAGWAKTSGSEIILEYTGLNNTVLREGDEKYITLALDLVSKTAGDYVNEAIISDEDLMLYQHDSASNMEGE